MRSRRPGLLDTLVTLHSRMEYWREWWGDFYKRICFSLNRRKTFESPSQSVAFILWLILREFAVSMFQISKHTIDIYRLLMLDFFYMMH